MGWGVREHPIFLDSSMHTERKLIPAEPDSPNRCQAKGDIGEGQCIFEAVESQKYCPKHGGTKAAERDEKHRVHDYRIRIWQTRLDEFAESNNVKNLRGEIAVCRHLLESILNQCKDSNDLLIYSGRISDLSVKINTLVTTCQKFEANAGLMLDKSAALILASQIVEVISQEIKDPESIDRISNGIITIIAQIGK